MKKRILSFLLALCMCLTLVPVTVLADDDVQQINDAAVQAVTPDSDTSVQSVVEPDNDKYLTYEFYVDGEKIDTQIVKNGDTLYEPPVTAPAGKTFTGWEPAVTFGTVTGVTETKTITVNAQFKDGYHVYFKDNNDRIIATKTGASGAEVTFEDVTFPVGSDEAITGWYTDDGTKVTSVTIGTTDITLYAKVEKGFWITFESNGGSYVAPAFYANGTPAAAPDEPTKSGYTFVDWFTDEALTKEANFDLITEATTLYAKWTASKQTQYTVIHWLENADDDGYSYKESETETGTTGGTTRATAKSYTGFTAQTITQETIKGDGSTIVSVYYKRNEYSVKFYTNSSLFSASTEYTALRITAKYGANISAKWPTYNGSSTWATSNNGSKYQVNIDTMPLGGANFYGPKTDRGSETAYYYVEVLPGETGTNYHGVTYKEDHKDTSPGTGYHVTDEDKYPITGFTFKEFSATRALGGKYNYNNAKFYYTRNSYDLVFISGGKTVKTEPVKYQASITGYANYEPDTAPKGMEDYVFDGWYASKECTGEAYDFTGKTMPANNITLYAKWVAPTYTVTVYDQNDTKIGEITVKKGDTVTDELSKLEAQLKLTLADGDSFLGWTINRGLPFNPGTKITMDYNLYAKVGNSTGYSVTYNANATGATGSVTDNEKYAKGAKATVKSNSFTNVGKDFLSWNTAADGTGTTYYPNSTVEITGDVTLYAQWGDKASTVSVTYHSNFGTDQTETVNGIANNGQITVAAYNDTLGLPMREGYTFAGWNTEANGSGTKFSAGDSARVNKTGSNDLYAQWTINQYAYTVKYYIDGTIDDSLTETHEADFGTEIKSYTNKCPTGYVLEKTENLPLTIGVNESANVIKVFYKKNVFNLTIHYVYAEDQSKAAAPDHTESVTFNDTYSVTSPDIPGYTANKTVVEGTMPAENVVETVTYSKRTDLSYTVHYYWNDTTESVKPSETFGNQTYQDKVTKSPAAIDGYTAVSKDSKTITIGTGANVIIFYYYKNVELTAVSGSREYNGSEQTISGYTADTAGVTFDGISASGSGTYVGEYDVTFTGTPVGKVDTSAKYIVTKANNGKLTITPVTAQVTVTIKGHKDTKTYDGKEYTVKGYDVVSISNDLYSADNVTLKAGVTAEATGTNVKAGGYLMGLTVGSFQNTNTNFSNVKFVVEEDGKLTIEKRNVTLTSDGGQKPYDGTPLTKPNVTVTGDGFVDGEVTDIKATGSVTYVSDGEVTNTITYTTGEKFNADNYNISTSEGKLKITANATEIVVKIKGKTLTETYDGKVHSVTGYDVVSVSDTRYTANDFTLKDGVKAEATGTNVKDGGYPMGLTENSFENINTNFSNVKFEVEEDGKLTIEKRNVTLTSGSASKEYDGTPLTKDEVKVTGDGFATGEGATYDVTGTITTVGEVDNEFTYTLNSNTKDSNYNITTVKGKLEITDRAEKYKITVKANSDSKTYDGTALTVEGFETLTFVVNGETYTVSGLTASKTGTNVRDSGAVVVEGTAVVKDAKGNDVTSQFNVTTVNGLLTIKPAEVTVTIEGNTAEATYDGEEHSVTDFKVKDISNNLYKEEYFALIEGVTAEAKGTNAGDYMMGLNKDSFENTNPNFEVTFVVKDGKLTIKPAEVTVTIKGNTKTETYDGIEYTVTGYTVESISNNLYKEEYFALIEGVTAEAKGTNAGDYMMGLTKESFENKNTNFKVTFVVEDGKLTIAKRDVTVTGESATKVYNGQTQEINGYTVDNLVTGHVMTGVTYSAKGKDPGKYNGSFNDDHKIVIKDAAGTDVTANYNVKPVIGVLTITQPSHPTRPSTPTKDVTSVKTADGSQMALWMSMMLASAAGIVFLGKKRKEEQ